MKNTARRLSSHVIKNKAQALILHIYIALDRPRINTGTPLFSFTWKVYCSFREECKHTLCVSDRVLFIFLPQKLQQTFYINEMKLGCGSCARTHDKYKRSQNCWANSANLQGDWIISPTFKGLNGILEQNVLSTNPPPFL